MLIAWAVCLNHQFLKSTHTPHPCFAPSTFQCVNVHSIGYIITKCVLLFYVRAFSTSVHGTVRYFIVSSFYFYYALKISPSCSPASSPAKSSWMCVHNDQSTTILKTHTQVPSESSVTQISCQCGSEFPGMCSRWRLSRFSLKMHKPLKKLFFLTSFAIIM